MARGSERTEVGSKRARPPFSFACLLLVAAILAVYWDVISYDFVIYDDPEYVYENPPVRSGLTWEGVRWAFTTTHQANWHPLTWLSLMLDASIAGVDPTMFHATSLLLHAANTLLLFLFLDRATGARGRSLLVSALFAVHPLHVESVAWIAERKDVLSTLFLFLTLLAWLRYVRKPDPARYVVVAILLGLGLMAKPMLVTVPVLLLLLDFWPLRRFTPATGSTLVPAPSVWGLVREKLPLLVGLSGTSALVTIYAQHAGESLMTFEAYSVPVRIANAVVGYSTYLLQTVWPSGLAVFYPHPGSSLSWEKTAAAGLFLLATTGVVLTRARSLPYLAFGWIWYLITLLPVIGLVQVGFQSTADRYTYVPLVGVFVAAAWGVWDLASWGFERDAATRSRIAIVLTTVALAWVLVLGVVARAQTRFWRDGVTLFERAIAVTGHNPVADINLGAAYHDRGDLVKAEEHFAEAVRREPRYAHAWMNLGVVHVKQGRLDEAIRCFEEALRVDPSKDAARRYLETAREMKASGAPK